MLKFRGSRGEPALGARLLRLRARSWKVMCSPNYESRSSAVELVMPVVLAETSVPRVGRNGTSKYVGGIERIKACCRPRTYDWDSWGGTLGKDTAPTSTNSPLVQKTTAPVSRA